MATQIETRITDWIDVSDLPEWQNGQVAAYRIWQQFDGRTFWQCHQWRFRDETTTSAPAEAADWIRGYQGWCPNSHSVTDAGQIAA